MNYLEQARILRTIIETAVQSLSDSEALEAVTLHPEWSIGKHYHAGHKVQHGGKLWRCRQAHTSQSGWEPENVPALWEEICETHDGTLADPIPYEGNMALVSGKYYIQDGVTYLCSRDTGSPVYHALSELVGLYVEEVRTSLD